MTPAKTCVMKKAGGGKVVNRLLYSLSARTGVPLQCPGYRRPPRGVDSWEPYASACSIPAMNQAGLLPTSHSWTFRNNTQHSWLFNNLFGLAQDGSDTPGNQGDEPRPIRRTGALCPDVSRPIVPGQKASPRSTPILTPLQFLLTYIIPLLPAVPL